MASNSEKIAQKSAQESIYFLEEKRSSGNIYAFVCSTLTSAQELIEDIGDRHPKLKGKLSPFAEILIDGKDTKNWFKNELNQLEHNKVILKRYYDHENHDILYIETPEGAAKSAETTIKELIKRRPVKKKSNSTYTSIMVIVSVILGILFLSQLSPNPDSESESIPDNTSSESNSYKDCVDGGGGQACLKPTQDYKDCVNYGGGQACKNLLNQ